MIPDTLRTGDRPEWLPSQNLVYTSSGDSLETASVDGQVLMDDRELKTIDLNEVRAKHRELAPKPTERANVKPKSRWPII